MTRRYVLAAVLFAAVSGAAVFAYTQLRDPRPPLSPGFRDGTYRNSAGEVFHYGLFVPPEYKGDESYPLVVFLHGYGERGRDGRRPLKVALAAATRWRMKKGQTIGFLALFPQSRSGFWNADSTDTQMAMDILADVESKYRIDPQRIYLTGVSNGGYGVWNLAAQYPDRWAALVPVGGGERASIAPRIAHIPCWCFHGQDDRDIPVERPRRMMQALRRAGGSPRYTEYRELRHAVWDDAYHEPALYEWLLAQQRSS